MSLKLQCLLVGLMALTAPSIQAYAEEPADVLAISAAIADPRRPQDQVRLDPMRKPAQLLTIAGVKAGQRVADFMPGNAYFTRLLSAAVGPAGHVYAFIPAEQIANCPPSEIAGTQALARDPSYGNVSVLTDSVLHFRAPELLDLIWTSQNYHDLHDAFMGPPDIALLNKALFDALKPGGELLIVDHVAESGSGLRDTETLHRIDPLQLQREVEAAGFMLEAHSDALRNPDDDHSRAVFDPAIRGHTDQVVLRFRKPN